MITHGKTFTSKVSLREVCEAIKKYGFVASPYPIIISAEVHCSVPQQDMIAEIMISVFGDSLVREPPEGLPKIDALPSPEELKGKIMLKVRIPRLYVLDLHVHLRMHLVFRRRTSCWLRPSNRVIAKRRSQILLPLRRLHLKPSSPFQLYARYLQRERSMLGDSLMLRNVRQSRHRRRCRTSYLLTLLHLFLQSGPSGSSEG